MLYLLCILTTINQLNCVNYTGGIGFNLDWYIFLRQVKSATVKRIACDMRAKPLCLWFHKTFGLVQKINFHVDFRTLRLLRREFFVINVTFISCSYRHERENFFKCINCVGVNALYLAWYIF